MPEINEPCLSCRGRCCTRFAVGVTGADAKRLSEAGHSLEKALTVQEHSQDMNRGFPALFVDGKKALLCLNRRKNERCVFFNGEKGCVAYAARTMVCRTYPFRLAEGRILRVEKPACTGEYALSLEEEKEMLGLLKQQEKELAEFKKFTQEWNGKGGGSFAELLEALRVSY